MLAVLSFMSGAFVQPRRQEAVPHRAAGPHGGGDGDEFRQLRGRRAMPFRRARGSAALK